MLTGFLAGIILFVSLAVMIYFWGIIDIAVFRFMRGVFIFIIYMMFFVSLSTGVGPLLAWLSIATVIVALGRYIFYLRISKLRIQEKPLKLLPQILIGILLWPFLLGSVSHLLRLIKQIYIDKNINNDNNDDLLEARMEAFAEQFGEMEADVLHALIPMQLGFDAGGRPHVYFYKQHKPGVLAVTAGLIGMNQKESDAGNYELMILSKTKNNLLNKLIQNLSFYTLDASINSGETMDCPLTDSISAVIFDCYKKFPINDIDAGIMAVIGITQKELDYKNEYGGQALLNKLKEANIYPYFDVERASVV